MERKERFGKAYQHLKAVGAIRTQNDVAERMGSTQPNVSSALKGVDAVLTDKFIRRFNDAFGNMFQTEWLLTGNGQMLREHTGVTTQSVHHVSNAIVAGGNNSGNVIESGSTAEAKASTPSAYDALMEVVRANQSATERFLSSIEKSQQQIDRLLTLLEKAQGA